MSASQTHTLEITNDAAPAEALEVESSNPLNPLDTATVSTTKATVREASTTITDQANLPVSTTPDAEPPISTTDITPTVPVTTKSEATQQETQPVTDNDVEVTERTESTDSGQQNTPSSLTTTEDNHSTTGLSVSEVQPTSSDSTTAVTEVPTLSFVDLPFGTDWIMVIVFLFTVGFLSMMNRKAIKKAAQLAQSASRPTMPMQNPTVDVEFEKAKLVAESRQQWIHSLREEVAKFVSATNAIWDLHKIKDGCEDILADMNDPQFVMKELYQWSCTYNKAVQDTEQLYTKIHLLINPNEEKAQTLCKLLDRTMVAIEAKKSPSKINDDIIAMTQEILKDEWERVKTFN